MDDQTIKVVVEEIEPLLVGRAPGKVFQLGPLTLAIDFRLRDHGYLLLSVDPAQTRLHLIKRRVRDLEKQSLAPGQFALALRKELSGATVSSVQKDPLDRIVRFSFVGEDDLGEVKESVLVVQLTGRAANLLLLDQTGRITHQARPARGQQPGEQHLAPSSGERKRKTGVEQNLLAEIAAGESVSEALDAFFNSIDSQNLFDTKAAAALGEVRRKTSRQEKLLKQLQADLASHADAEHHKRVGDLLLANVSTATRNRNQVKLLDYFTEGSPALELEVDENLTIPQEAARRFNLYSRSKRAVGQINSRIEVVTADLTALYRDRERLEKVIEDRDEATLERLTAPKTSGPRIAAAARKRKPEPKIPGTRRYISSDGFEILVGRGSQDNDHLTFKVARPNDLWLHAGDYPGSHVVVRNSTRKDIPHRTIIEAAQLAAHFSQARSNAKVDVHYTPRKFLSKPKGAAPGLARMSRFKNITVTPREELERI